jgi:hypothetical protein
LERFEPLPRWISDVDRDVERAHRVEGTRLPASGQV